MSQLTKILIFGNSGSGKSTLAKRLANKFNIAHLDLDTLAWLPQSPPVRKPINDSKKEIDSFLDDNEGWVIEGGYTDLLSLLSTDATEIIFLNLSIEASVINAKNRPWEPHKYASKKMQDENLEMLIEWIKAYETRDDLFSYQSHLAFYEAFQGKKSMITKENLD